MSHVLTIRVSLSGSKCAVRYAADQKQQQLGARSDRSSRDGGGNRAEAGKACERQLHAIWYAQQRRRYSAAPSCRKGFAICSMPATGGVGEACAGIGGCSEGAAWHLGLPAPPPPPPSRCSAEPSRAAHPPTRGWDHHHDAGAAANDEPKRPRLVRHRERVLGVYRQQGEAHVMGRGFS